jgi:hypothetical protein
MCKGPFRISKKKINNGPDGASHNDIHNKSFDTVDTGQQRWQKFISNVKAFDDLVLVTMFCEAQFISFDAVTSIISVSFLKKFMFFGDVLEKEKKRWLLVLQNIFGHQAQLQFNFEFLGQQKNDTVQHQVKVKSVQVSNLSSPEKNVDKVDVFDGTTWKLAHELMKHFDGVITEISRDMYE